jgi:hypothetical protein
MNILQLLSSRRYCPANIMQLNSAQWPGVLVIQTRGGPNRKHRFQQFFYCFEWLPSDNLDTVDVFTGRYQATHVSSRDRCIATVLHVTL